MVDELLINEETVYMIIDENEGVSQLQSLLAGSNVTIERLDIIY